MTHAAAALPAPARRPATHALVRGEFLTAAGVALLATLVFANALANGFVLDDRGIILSNPLVQQIAHSWRAFGLPYWPDTLGGGQYRPLAILHFALDWRVGGGSPLWFHALNVLWHAAATVLVWRLAAPLLAPAFAILCAALFAVHPVHVEAVANVVGRLELMAAVFALGTLLAHRAGSWLAIPLFACGLLSKENAIVTLGLVAASDLLLAPRPSPLARRRSHRLHFGYAGVVILYIATLAIVFHNRPFHVQTGTLAGASLAERLWTMATVIPHYIRLLLLPASLSADYEPQVIPAAQGLTAAGAVGLLCLAAYGAGIVVAWKRHRPLAFALVWIGIALAPVTNVFFASGVTLSERSLYLPSVGAMVALGILLQGAWAHRPALAYGVAGALLVAGCLRTWTRTPVWHDDRTYTLTLLEDHPESFRAHWVAGRVYRASGQLDAAARELAIARRLFGGVPALYLESAEVAARTGDARSAALLQDSAATLTRSRP